MCVLVVGGSAVGFLGTLLDAQVSHEVSVLERHNLAFAADAETAAASVFRAGAPQPVQPSAPAHEVPV